MDRELSSDSSMILVNRGLRHVVILETTARGAGPWRQNPDGQRDALTVAGCDEIYERRRCRCPVDDHRRVGAQGPPTRYGLAATVVSIHERTSLMRV